MCNKQAWHYYGRNEERRAEHPRIKLDPNRLVKGKEEIGCAPHIEQPHE